MNNKINFLFGFFGQCSSAALLGFALLATSASADICWKDSYGRGVGTIPNACAPGFSPTGFGTCAKDCPAGFRNDGLFCAKPAAYGRGAGYPWKFGDKAFSLDGARSRCQAENPQGCEKDGAIIYPICKPGFHKVGCCVCSPDCPGMTDIGVSCAKPTQVASCPMGKQNDAGLCYNPCAGMKGIGPVCWGGCPAGMIDCGAMCGGSVTECLSAVGDSVIAGATAIAKIAAMVSTLGASAGIGSGVTGVVEAVKQGATDKAKELATSVKSAGEAIKAAGQGMLETLQKKGLSVSDLTNTAKMIGVMGQNEYESMKKALGGDAGIAALTQAAQAGGDWEKWLKLGASLDPTGLAQFALTFKRPICGR